MWNSLMAKATTALITEYPFLFGMSGGKSGGKTKTGGTNYQNIAEWNLGDFVKNSKEKIAEWGGAIIVIMGLIMMLVGAVKIGKGLMSHGQGQPPNWVINILLVVAGGAFTIFGFGLFKNFGEMAAQDLEQLGHVALMLFH